MSIEARRAPQLLLPRGGVDLRAAILWALWDQTTDCEFLDITGVTHRIPAMQGAGWILITHRLFASGEADGKKPRNSGWTDFPDG
jgi:hypothetical protein